MALDLTVARPKLAQTVSVDCDLTVGTVVENDSDGSLFIPILLADQNPASFTVASCTTTNASTTVSGSGGLFSGVAVGDAVSGTGIAGGTTVSAKAGNNNSITLSQAATASGTVTLTFDPPNITTPTFAAIKVTFTPSGATLVPTFTFYKYDGSLKGTPGSDSNASSSVSLSPASSAAIDYDSFLSTLRVTRTNS